jgi:hypothetical protein
MKYLLIIFIISAFSNISNGQAYYQKIFGDSLNSEKGQLVHQTPDGTIYFIGSAFGNTTNRFDVTLHKMKPDGEIIWKQTFVNPGNDYVFDMVYKNGIFVLVGGNQTPNTSNVDASLMTVDTSGQFLNYQTFGAANKNEFFHSIAKTSDNGYILGGFATGNFGTGNDFYLVKVDNFFIKEWQQIRGSYINEVGSKALEMADGNFIIVGDQLQQTGNYNVYCQFFAPDGTYLKDLLVQSPYNGGCKTAILDAANNIVIAGEMSTATSFEFDVYLVKLNPNGDLIWTNYLTDEPDGGAAFSMIQSDANNYIFAGYGRNPLTNNQDVIIISADTAGNVMERKYFGGSTAEIGYGIFPSVYGGFLISGYTSVALDNQYFLVYDELQLAVATVEKSMIENKISIFPNPLTQQVFRFNIAIEKVKIGIYNTNGQLLEQRYFDQSIDEYQLQSNLPTGNYFVNLQFEKYSKTISIIIK